MNIFNLLVTTVILIASACCTAGVLAAQNTKTVPKVISILRQPQIQNEASSVDIEQHDIEEELLATNQALREELATVKISLDLAKKEVREAHKELEHMRNAVAENQDSMDAILNDLQGVKKDLANATIANESLRSKLVESSKKNNIHMNDGSVVPITPDIIPARPMNLGRIAIKSGHQNRGIVVVNVLINENGEVLDTKLLQGLPGHGESIDAANATCVERAKQLMFDPARTIDGKTKVRVWQGVGMVLG